MAKFMAWADQWLGRMSGAYGLWPLVPTGLGAGLLAYASTSVRWMNQLGPFGWGSVALIAFLALSLSLYMLALFRERWVYASYARKRAQEPDFINPLDNDFTKKRIQLAAMKRPSTNYIENKTFTDCEILGPAMVLMDGCELTGNGMINCNWVVTKQGAEVFGAILLKNLKIRGGTLHDLTIIVPENMIGLIKALPVSPMNRTGDREIDARPSITKRVHHH